MLRKGSRMAKLILLGTAHAIPHLHQDNSHLLLVSSDRIVLIDTSTNPIVRLRQAGVDPTSLTDLILTHFHPDHVSGVPLLLLDSWLLGRRAPLKIYGLSYTLERIEKLMDLFGWMHWPGFFSVEFVPLPEDELTPVLQGESFSISSSPVRHMIPNIGLRIEFQPQGQVVAYSGDTEPAPEVVRLANEADLLLHEATGEERGHTSAAQAGLIARQANARRLLLIHYNPEAANSDQLVEQARTTFHGPVELARDFVEMVF